MNNPIEWPAPVQPGSMSAKQARALNDGPPVSGEPSRIVARRASDIKPVPPRYLKPLWYPLGVISMVAGKGGSGKSTIVLGDIAAATRGTFTGDIRHPINVALIAPEDDDGLQVARMEATGVDRSRVFFIKSDPNGLGYDDAQTLRIPADLEDLRDFCRTNAIGLIVIDPINVTMAGSDSNKRDDVRRVLDALTRLAKSLDLAVVCIAHMAKGGGNRSDMMAGSAAFRDVPRSVLVAAIDDDGKRGVIEIDKNSYGEGQGKAWDYSLESVEIVNEQGQVFRDPDGKPKTVPVARILGESDRRVEHILNRAPETEEKAEERETCTQALYAYLESVGGSAPAADVQSALKKQGYTDTNIRQSRYRAKNPKVISNVLDGVQWWTIEGTQSDSVTPQPPVTRENVAIPTMLHVTPTVCDSVTETVTPPALHPLDTSTVTRNAEQETAEYQQKTTLQGTLHPRYAPQSVTQSFTTDGQQIRRNETLKHWEPSDPKARREWYAMYPRPELIPDPTAGLQDSLNLTV